MPKSEFLNILTERGFIHQCTDLDKLDELFLNETVTAYIGFDCTAKSFHVGSLIQIMLLHWLQKTGHKPIVLMGGGTTKIGDPSFKDEARKILAEEEIEKNIQSLKTVFDKFLQFIPHLPPRGRDTFPITSDEDDTGIKGHISDAILINNDDWLKGLEYIPFLRDFGRHFSVNRMLSFDSVKIRLDREQSLSFLEFNYMILQAYDFYLLNKEYNCKLQMGGSDQWGNIVNGVELTRRVSGNEVFGLTTPLITTSSGAKMGKTEKGAVWLNGDMLSPYDYWQFWRNTQDDDVGRFLRLFTTLPISEIEKLEGLKGNEINEAKKVLADEATKLCHGEEEAGKARETAEKTFEQGITTTSLPTVEIAKAELEQGITAFKLFQMSGLAKSGGEARRLIRGGGARINDEVVADEEQIVDISAVQDGAVKLSSGKKKHILIKTV